MKKGLYIIAAGIMAASALSSCDSVSEPDRFIEVEIIPQRAILIEEFTGQGCTNCPDGHVAIKDMLSTLGDSIVPVSIHASGLALNPPNGFKTQAGETYYQNVGSPELPTAVINMQTNPLQVSSWSDAIGRLILQPTPFTVKADARVDGDKYSINVAFSSGEDYEGKLMVWILQNDLISRQLDHGTMIQDYVHSHVFRTYATDDIWGEPVSLKAHEPQYRDFTYTIPAAWGNGNLNASLDNLYVVAFLYNNDGVAQVTSTMKE